MKVVLRLLAGILLVASNAAAATVAIVVGEPGQVHREIAEIVHRGIAEAFAGDVAVIAETEFSRPQKGHLRVVVAVGARAFEAVLATDPTVPVLATLIPRQTYEALLRPRTRAKTTAVFLDQPLERQLDLLRAALPDRHRLGVLLGPDSVLAEPSLRRSAEKRALHVSDARVKDAAEVPRALQGLISRTDVLLALPDAAVFGNPGSRNILRAAFAEGVPLVAYSPSYVKAGALLALYSTPLQLGRQTAEVARAMLGGALPPPRHPRDYTIETNRYIARSLGLDIPDGNALVETLRRLEQAP